MVKLEKKMSIEYVSLKMVEKKAIFVIVNNEKIQRLFSTSFWIVTVTLKVKIKLRSYLVTRVHPRFPAFLVHVAHLVLAVHGRLRLNLYHKNSLKL